MSELDTFIETCTDGVHPDTVAAIIELVTDREPFILTALPFKGKRQQMAFADRNTTIKKGIDFIEADAEISVGYMQVSSRYWLLYDVTVMDMLEPCANIQVGSSLLKEGFQIAMQEVGDEQSAMRLAVERYIEGNLYTGGKEAVVKLFGHEQPAQQATPLVQSDTSTWAAEIRVSGFDELMTVNAGTLQESE